MKKPSYGKAIDKTSKVKNSTPKTSKEMVKKAIKGVRGMMPQYK